MSESPVPSFDAAAVAATVRKGDMGLIRGLYRRIPREVLLHLMVLAQVGGIRPANLPDSERTYHDGRASLALEILNLASVDPIDASLAIITTTLEGQDDDRYSGSGLGPDEF